VTGQPHTPKGHSRAAAGWAGRQAGKQGVPPARARRWGTRLCAGSACAAGGQGARAERGQGAGAGAWRRPQQGQGQVGLRCSRVRRAQLPACLPACLPAPGVVAAAAAAAASASAAARQAGQTPVKTGFSLPPLDSTESRGRGAVLRPALARHGRWWAAR